MTERNKRVVVKGLKAGKAKDKIEYEKTSTTRSHFKRACKTHNWDFNDFYEVFDKKIKHKSGSITYKYFYFYQK